ncbi:DUF1642 domain-containing protein [Robertmurraya sp. DFI.2.37]|uniref:DUF1642 domain-containing protein n=1 Tax=Robertmurraya sp. DFI.2.37 TaxID=3031819 RepID=UPI001244A1D3|nr:DUF1642 domain-containing protein [Robertmurraya sp. DFI.2.37]MDF1510706.1 DUF1642 domain-containing protein [Robertmurraya sp. DFI.2.37]
MNKVTLPREVADVLGAVKTEYSLFNIIESLRYYGKGRKSIPDSRLEKLHDWCEEDETTEREDLIITALVNGYEIEQSPEDKLREYYEGANFLRYDASDLAPTERQRMIGKQMGVRRTLNILGIKIEGINADSTSKEADE